MPSEYQTVGPVPVALSGSRRKSEGGRLKCRSQLRLTCLS